MATGEFAAAVAQVREMFPQHSAPIVEAALRQNRGSVDAAISFLLTVEPDLAAPPRPAPPQQPAQRAPAQHIFPPDFLRWPPDAPVVREEIGAAAPAPAPAAEPGRAFRMAPVSAAPLVGKPKGGWAHFKARFKGKKKEYSQL
jgi:hypothetical protein